VDVPDGRGHPKLGFPTFDLTADFFTTIRRGQASLGLAKAHGLAASDNGIEGLRTASRRQNFLVPPRRHRAFPLM
jgi:hypothetical protein